MDFLNEFLTLQNALLAAGAIISFIIIVLGKQGLDFLAEIKDVIDTYRRAIDPASPGGSDVTEEERQAIRKEAIEALNAIWNRFGGTFLGWIGKKVVKLKFW